MSKQDYNTLNIKTGQTLLLKIEEYGKDHVRRKRYQRWKAAGIYKNIVLCERKVKLGIVRESFTWQQLSECLIRTE